MASERERLYDEEIAPALMELGRKCENAGLSFLALVEYEPGETAQTVTWQKNAGIEFQLAEWAVRAQGNIDALVIDASRYAHKHGHGSVVLKQMGVPLTPTPEVDDD